MHELWRRLTRLANRKKLDAEIDDELAFHLAMRTSQLEADGREPREAAFDAQRRFGNPVSTQESMRDLWSFQLLETFWSDLRYSARRLGRDLPFTIAAVFGLALGIGASASIFSLVSAVALRPLPYDDAHDLVLLIGNVRRNEVERRGGSLPDFRDWRREGKSFEDMAAFDTNTVTLTGEGEVERVNVETVTPGYFPLLRLQPALGRFFLETDDLDGKPERVVVISDALWKSKFGGDPDILGRKLIFNAEPTTVIGVAPPGLKGISDAAQLWAPFGFSGYRERGTRGLQVIARLKPGVTREQAQAEMTGIAAQLERAYPETNEKRGVEVAALDQELLGNLRPAAAVLFGATILVLCLACANVANLLLARYQARDKEFAVRAALGAGQLRIARQVLTEALLLTTAGAVSGLLVAAVAVKALAAASPIAFPSFSQPQVDGTVLAFSVGISLLIAIILGLMPLWHGTGSANADGSLKVSSVRSFEGRGARRFRNLLVISEAALAVILLAGAALLMRSYQELMAVDLGFNPQQVLTLRFTLPRLDRQSTPQANAAPDPAVANTVRALIDNVKALPGVRDVALGTDVPLNPTAPGNFFTAEGQPPVNAQNIPRALVHSVSDGFFRTLQIPLLAGREFNPRDLQANSSIVVVSEKVAKRFWPNESAIGKRIKRGGPQSNAPWLEIVGVVKEVKYRGVPANPTPDPDLYFPITERSRNLQLAVRTEGNPAALASSLRAIIREVDPSIPIWDIATMNERVQRETARARFTGWLMGIFAMVALILTAIGIYAVLAYSVTRRIPEIGVRLSLGANPRDVLGLVLKQGMTLVAIGLALGIGLSIVFAQGIQSLLFGVRATDPGSFVVVSCVLLLVAAAACFGPARRASRTQPSVALRYE
jgi:predicted permease